MKMNLYKYGNKANAEHATRLVYYKEMWWKRRIHTDLHLFRMESQMLGTLLFCHFFHSRPGNSSIVLWAHLVFILFIDSSLHQSNFFMKFYLLLTYICYLSPIQRTGKMHEIHCHEVNLLLEPIAFWCWNVSPDKIPMMLTGVYLCDIKSDVNATNLQLSVYICHFLLLSMINHNFMCINTNSIHDYVIKTP